jgi:hypothetical protein
MTINIRNVLGGMMLTVASAMTAQTHVLDINTKKLGAPVQKTMYGLFFEDIK